MAYPEALTHEGLKILSLFPIDKASVHSAVEDFLQDSTNLGWDEYLDLREPDLDVENPYAFEYLKEVADGLDEIDNMGFRLGIIIAFDVFKRKMETDNLPVLSNEFIQDYDYTREERLKAVYGKSIKSRNFGDDKEEEIRRGLFTMIEKEAYEALDKELSDEDEPMFDNSVFGGFVASYFLLRQGLSSPLNWEIPRDS